MEKTFITLCQIVLLTLCFFFSLGALSGMTYAEAPGEGLFERMVIDKFTSLEISIRDLTKRLEEIEKRLSKVEKNLAYRPVPSAPWTSSGSGEGAFIPQEPPKKRLKATVPKEKDIGEGLKVVNVDYHGTGDGKTFFKGEIENNTNDNIAYALFKIEVYGEQGNLLGIESFELKDMLRAWPKKFTLLIYRVDEELIADYSIKRLK
jgi:hypothetical protein